VVFSSSVFLFLFLPCFLAAYYLTPERYRSWTILAGSTAFYGWWRVDFLALLLGVSVWSWAWARVNVAAVGKAKRRALAVGITGNLGALAYFKYWNFGVDNLNALLTAAGVSPLELGRVLLPIGISFYVFQAISYLVDVHRGDAPPEKSLVSFAAFISLFPQLIAGPVLRYKDLADQFQQREHSLDRFAEGARRFMVGFCMKVLVADVAAPVADHIFGLTSPSFAEAWLGTLAYTVQLFFDFAGYSHMAIGLGLMMGFRFIENFDQPYISGSITEFWRRWHISLSSWLRDYLYIPLGGNRKGPRRTYVNLLLTMLLGGLWHGAAWTFLLWGAWHGLWLSIERHRRHRLTPGGLDHPLAMARTMLLVMVGWVMFRAPDVGGALDIYTGMLGLNGLGIRDTVAWQLPVSGMLATLIGLLLVYSRPLLERTSVARAHGLKAVAPGLAQLLVVCGFVLAVLRLGALQHSPFLYFQF